MPIDSALEIQELLRVQDGVRVQNPYKNASLARYIIESKGWLRDKGTSKTLYHSQDIDKKWRPLYGPERRMAGEVDAAR